MLTSPEKQNILLITIDSLRADFCGWLNPKTKDLTPFLNELASQSVYFTKAYAPGPNTAFSFPGILTGTYPFSFVGWDGNDFPALNQRPNLAEMLSQKGYHTIAVHSNPYLSHHYGYDKGFIEFNDIGEISSVKMETTFRMLNRKNILYRTLKSYLKKYLPAPYNLLIYFTVVVLRQNTKYCPYKKAKDINERAIQSLQKKPEKPYFLWLHYMDTHHPFLPTKRFYSKDMSPKEMEFYLKLFYKLLYRNVKSVKKEDLERIKDLYRDAVKTVDESLRDLFSFLNEKGFLRNTVILICADHGEEFMEKGNTGHKEKLIPEILRVPLILKASDRRGEIDKKVSLTQIPATLLELAGIKTFPIMEPSLLSESKPEIKSELVTDYDSVLINFNLNTYQKIIH